jgi:hypothetical protein
MCELCWDKDLDKIRQKLVDGATEEELIEMINETKYKYMLDNGRCVDSILYPMFR